MTHILPEVSQHATKATVLFGALDDDVLCAHAGLRALDGQQLCGQAQLHTG